MSYNNLQGSIPVEVGNLQQLVELHLSSNKLTGEIPDALSQCQILQIIEMDQNFLTGSIPISLSNIKSLTSLNLSHNNLSGNIPTDMEDMPVLSVLDLSYNDLQGEIPRNGVFKNSTAVSLRGNRGFCGGVMNFHMPPCTTISQRRERRSNLIKILIPIFGFMSLALLLYFLFLLKKTSRRTHLPLTYVGENFPKVSYTDLAQATKNFSASELIGRGSYGSVYRGKLKESKTDVAVKVFDLEMRGAERSFLLECEALRSIQHRNLLPIITACSTVDSEGNVFKALVYEFMPNGSLDRWLHKEGDGKFSKRLGVTHRINIAVNIADALDYLHHDCGRPTIHCDLKPSNILLDDDMTALLGDFGIARFYADPSTATVGTNSSIGIKGTIGYIAPEYAGGSRASTSGDVYSFGIVLLEMMTAKRPTDTIFKDGLDIVTFVSNNVPHQIHNVIDAHLIEECKDSAEGKTVSEHVVFQSVVSLLEVALSCTGPLPSGRMNMKQVASKLHAIKTSYLAGCNAKK
uniref:Receptor kinase-like protein Xa21 n=1 Tax=Oryza glumipatula TaxID=40148 RepID=A0A0D9YUY8_9ORYZ